MNKKMIKILTIISMVIMIASMSTMVLAAGQVTQPNKVVADTNVAGLENVENLGAKIVGIIQSVGIILSIIILIIIGIKYMMGSAEEKAEYKKTMIPYVVGAVLIFAASAFAQLIYNLATGLNVA